IEHYTIERSFSHISDAVRSTLAIIHREARSHALRKQAERILQASITKAERVLKAIEQDTEGAQRANDRQQWAEILMAQPCLHTKGLEKLETQDWLGNAISIPLQPALTLLENAEEYFKKAARSRVTLKQQEERKRVYERSLLNAQQALRNIPPLHNERELSTWLATLNIVPRYSATSMHNTTPSHNTSNETIRRFRQFVLSDAYTLYVGKTAADNDALTLRFAKPHDYWFHARGVPGSHAVLRCTSKDAKPPKHILEEAASIAAYFSKARHAKLAPVVYTQKKYVRKPKGAVAGAVVLEREDVLMVRPHIPQKFLGAIDNELLT
ncbi:MAG: NFACT RNA binding domain-containing protein, partial [Bacteroidota bacterium]|nr:NFACT RNA binding domain-containing protein [Candidatus Kapabacteria bacterium]MDW8220594.1 NFACT RNA binding domain-containing protein [Bacteroidota bacterium]